MTTTTTDDDGRRRWRRRRRYGRRTTDGDNDGDDDDGSGSGGGDVDDDEDGADGVATPARHAFGASKSGGYPARHGASGCQRGMVAALQIEVASCSAPVQRAIALVWNKAPCVQEGLAEPTWGTLSRFSPEFKKTRKVIAPRAPGDGPGQEEPALDPDKGPVPVRGPGPVPVYWKPNILETQYTGCHVPDRSWGSRCNYLAACGFF